MLGEGCYRPVHINNKTLFIQSFNVYFSVPTESENIRKTERILCLSTKSSLFLVKYQFNANSYSLSQASAYLLPLPTNKHKTSKRNVRKKQLVKLWLTLFTICRMETSWSRTENTANKRIYSVAA